MQRMPYINSCARATELTPLIEVYGAACCLSAVAGRINHENYKNWDYEDSHLTEFGWKQVRSAVCSPASKYAAKSRVHTNGTTQVVPLLQ
jgi:hypothetical protein